MFQQKRRVKLTCPVDGTHFSPNASEYRKYVRAGREPTCSKKCGYQHRVTRAAQGVVPA
jgi:hypothetical protein